MISAAGASAQQEKQDDDVAALKKELEFLKSRVMKLEKIVVEKKVLPEEEAREIYPAIEEEVAEEVRQRAISVPEAARISEQTTVDLLKQYSTQVASESRDILFKQPDYLPNYITKGLEFHGYFRSGYGVNSKGGHMEAFMAPDALAKYRLGNEQETYIEAILLNRNWNPDPDGVTLETQIRVAYQTQQNQTWDLTNQVILREMFGRMGSFLQWDKDVKVWAGQRFCRLPELDIIDFWWYDMSGYGGGFEDINCGIGKLDVTFIGYASNNINMSTQRGRLSKENVNFKLGDVDVPFGKGMFWANGGFIKGGVWTEDPSIKYPDMGGVDVGFMHYMPGELNNNQLGIQYGCGACTSLSAGGEIPTYSDNRKSWRVRLTDMFNRQITDKLCIQAVGVYQYTDYGAKTKTDETWVSLGCRPIYALTKHFGVEIEPGMDYINNPADDYDTCLFKLTGGIRISPGTIFNSRPEFRLFATYARWGDGFRGNPMLGGTAFLSQQEGMNYGIQCENWW
jgi:maltoporin